MSDSAGSGASTHQASGSSISPPNSSCQPVSASTGKSTRQRRVSQVPAAMHTAPANAAAMPTGSNTVCGDSSSTAMPAMPATAAHSVSRAGTRPSTPHASAITSSGCTAPSTAASPPGSR